MSRYPDPAPLDHAELERRILADWDARGTFEESLRIREGAPHFVFYEGPPTANGKPGIHHVMARTIKDLFCRYRTMKGFRVDRKGGWDTHGLPVEIEVEKELGLEGRHHIEEYGVAKYNEACRASVLRYKDLWDDLTRKMGYWVDLENPYITFENSYIESVWALLKRIHERKTPEGESFLYQGYKIQWYSPANATVLSSHEVSLGYEEIQDPSVYVKFAVDGQESTFFLAWTTTPWTLPSNAALAVGPKVDYVKVRQGAEVLWLAEARLSVLEGDCEIVGRAKGADLAGTTYEPLFDAFAAEVGRNAAWRVVLADFVTTEDGTGIVHLAPAFGADDFTTGRKEGLPLLNPITRDGRFDDTIEIVAGMWFKDADKVISRDLRERGLLYRHETYLHNYPHDWRKGTPLMQYPVESWFIRTTAIKDRLVELNKTINWQPEGIGTGRFGAWLEGNVDWAISRMRFWATPLPIWVSDRDPSHYEVIGSIEELMEKVGALPEEARRPETGELDLHRPYVDHLTWPDGKGGTMRRVPDLLDVWFDSGAMPFAQWHFPFENEDSFSANFPADFIAEGVDQTRGWFYTMHAIAALVEDSVAYKNVVVNGLVLDEKGEKMSKSKGNTVDPFQALQTHGADAVRWTMMAAGTPWDNLRYADSAVLETRRRFFLTLHNTFGFLATYANLDEVYRPEDAPGLAERPELDRWILSRLQSVITESDDAYEAYHPTRAARAIETFVDDLSNWYLRRSRRRFWKGDTGADKLAAYATLHECLENVALLMAPLAPFYAEWLYESLGNEHSVHLQDFPTAGLRDENLEHRMALARATSSAVLALRNEAKIGVRQPLKRVSVVVGAGAADEAALREVQHIILDEVNVKELAFIEAGSGLVQKSARPNFKTLGRRLGPLMKPVQATVLALSTDEIEAYEASGTLSVAANGQVVELGPGDIDVTSEGIEGQLVGQETVGGVRVTVALDTELDEELRLEGMAREFVNRVQSLRKTAGFAVEDRIVVTFQGSASLTAAIEAHSTNIASETLAHDITSQTPSGERVATFDIGSDPVVIGVRRA